MATQYTIDLLLETASLLNESSKPIDGEFKKKYQEILNLFNIYFEYFSVSKMKQKIKELEDLENEYGVNHTRSKELSNRIPSDDEIKELKKDGRKENECDGYVGLCSFKYIEGYTEEVHPLLLRLSAELQSSRFDSAKNIINSIKNIETKYNTTHRDSNQCSKILEAHVTKHNYWTELNKLRDEFNLAIKNKDVSKAKSLVDKINSVYHKMGYTGNYNDDYFNKYIDELEHPTNNKNISKEDFKECKTPFKRDANERFYDYGEESVVSGTITLTDPFVNKIISALKKCYTESQISDIIDPNKPIQASNIKEKFLAKTQLDKIRYEIGYTHPHRDVYIHIFVHFKWNKNHCFTFSTNENGTYFDDFYDD